MKLAARHIAKSILNCELGSRENFPGGFNSLAVNIVSDKAATRKTRQIGEFKERAITTRKVCYSPCLVYAMLLQPSCYHFYILGRCVETAKIDTASNS